MVGFSFSFNFVAAPDRNERRQESGSPQDCSAVEGVYPCLGVFREVVNKVQMLKGIHFILVS